MNKNAKNSTNEVSDKIINPKSGWFMLFVTILMFAIPIAIIVLTAIALDGATIAMGLGVSIIIVMGLISLIAAPIMCGGFKVLNPNEALVLTLFGKYYGTIATEGFYFVNPFVSGNNPAYSSAITASINVANGDGTVNASTTSTKKISIKALTLNNEKQKVNDLDGNPIEIGVIVIWKIVDAAKAVFNVENYKTFVSTQCDSAIRQVARTYPYDVSTEGDEKSLRGSSTEIAEVLKNELQGRTEFAGIEILEARISHLAYAPEIAAAMLQRQQASAVIAARQMIVEGAVGMVEMALNKLSENNVVSLDDERKAQMVSNLLVVLCGNKDAQPIVNSGSIY